MTRGLLGDWYTYQMDYNNLSEEIRKFVDEVSNVAVGYLKKGEMFSPFLASRHDGKNKMNKYQGGSLDKALELAENDIQNLTADICVLTYIDTITLKDKGKESKSTAIIFQIYGMEEDNGYSFALVYKFEGDRFFVANEKVFLGNIRNILIF